MKRPKINSHLFFHIYNLYNLTVGLLSNKKYLFIIILFIRMTSVRQRDKLMSSPRYRRQTIGMVYSPQNIHSMPNSARHSTPRPRSALDRKWVSIR